MLSVGSTLKHMQKKNVREKETNTLWKLLLDADRHVLT